MTIFPIAPGFFELFLGRSLENVVLPESFTKEIDKIGTRGRTENFFDGHPSNATMLYDTIRMQQGYVPAGIVRQVTPFVIAVRNPIECGDTLEYLGSCIKPLVCTVSSGR
jgi:putative protease